MPDGYFSPPVEKGPEPLHRKNVCKDLSLMLGVGIATVILAR